MYTGLLKRNSAIFALAGSFSLPVGQGERNTNACTPAQSAVAPAITWPGRRTGCPPGGKVSGDRSQLRVGPGRERVAYLQVEFVLGQHAAHERILESADHLLALGM